MYGCYLLWLSILLNSIVILHGAAENNPSVTKDIRLPASIVPEHYDISIMPDLDSSEIDGTVRMDFVVKSATDRIVMHGVNLTVVEDSIVVVPIDPSASTTQEQKHEVISVDYDDIREFIIMHLNSKLQPNRRYRISLDYTGFLSNNLKGLYRSDYFDLASQSKKVLGVTQFEPTSARLAFPCLDEPALKATFTMSLGRRSDYSSLSNMPLVRSSPITAKEGWFWDVFDKSVPMSTYLVACLISQFTFREARSVVRPTEDGTNQTATTEVRIWSRPDAINQTELAVQATPKMLEFLESYFQVPFPLPKVDLVALPDFSSGAMENWGLITYRETTLLVDPQSAPVRDEMNVERVIAHELAHQWFGNLVTMEWWNDLWLNEGFATYVQRLVLDHVSPKYEYGAQQSLNFLTVMDADALETSHPISVEVENPTQIAEIFDAISYTKGSAVIRMMNHFLSEKTFRQGVTNYLKQKKYLNARQDELWQFLTEQAHADGVLSTDVNVKSVMDTWTLQMGLPLITIKRNYTEGTAFIQQERFLRGEADDGNDEKKKKKKKNESKAEPSYTWWVPISFTNAAAKDFSENNTLPAIWLTPNKLSTTVRMKTAGSNWILANVLGTGFYRVNYDEQNWQLLISQLREDHEAVHVINRAHLVDDVFALAAARVVPYTTAFDLIGYLAKEKHYVPWSSALRSLAYIGRMFSHTPHYGRYKAFKLSLVVPTYLSLGTTFSPNDSPTTKSLRISMIGQACAQEYKPCITQAQDLFEQWMNSSDPSQFNGIIPDLRSTIYCTAIKFGGQAEWDFAWKQSLTASSALLRDDLLSALGCTREPWMLIRYLSFIMDPKSGVRKQDGRRVMSAVASNPVGRRLALNYVMKNFEKLFTYFGNPVRVLQMLSSAASSLNTREDLAKIQQFMESEASLLQAAQTSANNIQAVVAANIKWMESNYDILNDWFASKGFH